MSKEFVKELNKNPYVLKATEWTVSFTVEFKQLAYDEYYKGKSTKEIFSEAGFDCEKLGNGRLQNFRNKMISQAESECGFEDQRKYNGRKEAQSTQAQLEKKIKELEHRLAYLEQENDFLKKIQEAEKKCRRK